MIRYLEGGNPPVSPGLFEDHHGKRPLRIAWWPVGYSPTTINMAVIIEEYRRTGKMVTRQRAIELLSEEHE